jgi:hypothetical protein
MDFCGKQIKTHMMSPITRHCAWNIFILFSDLIMKFVNFLSLSCAVLCCSRNYCMLRIAIWNDYIIYEPNPVTARYKAWVCGRLFPWECEFESNRVYPFLYLVSVVFCHLEVSASGWSLVRRIPTECGVSDCDLEDPWNEALIQLRAEINY